MARRKKVKVYELPKDGAEYWQKRYEVGVRNGVRTYETMIPAMTQNYGAWVNFVLPEIVRVAKTLPEKIEGADPAANYERRGAPFARKFKELGKKFKVHKLTAALQTLGIAAAPEVVAPPAKVRELPPLA